MFQGHFLLFHDLQCSSKVSLTFHIISQPQYEARRDIIIDSHRVKFNILSRKFVVFEID